MRTTLPFVGILIAFFALGCSERAPLATAPPAPAPPADELPAISAAELAVERERSQMRAGLGGITQIAGAACEFDVAPEVFGTQTPVDNRLFYVAAKRSDGTVNGLFSYTQSFDGNTFRFSGRISCMHIYDFDGGTGNRAKIGGPIDVSNDPDIPVGTYIWWQTIDNAHSGGALPDKSTLSGFGNAAANEAFCNNPAPPRFGPWDVDRGDIRVHVLSSAAVAQR